MYEIGTSVIVRGGLELHSLDSKHEVIVTQDVINNAGKVGIVVEIDDGYYLLGGLDYEHGTQVYYSNEWLIPADEDYKVVCEHCGEEKLFADCVCTHGKFYCKECYDSLPICGSCGSVTTSRNLTIDGTMICDDCVIQENRIRSYDYTPQWSNRVVNNDDKSLLIGAEIEIDNGRNQNDTMKEITRVMGKSVVYEHDGSLNNGFEIVTHPFSYEFWHDRVEYIEKMFEIAKEHGYKAHDTRTCGLHLHVCKEQLSTDERDKNEVIDNIILIMETFMDEMIKFARRHNEEYAKFLQDCVYRQDSLTMKFVRRNKESYSGKYRALNINHGSTIEFRLFKGSLNIDTFMASIELVNNIVDIARFGELQDLTWLDIINHNDDKTRYIKEYNDSRGITSSKVVQVLSEMEIHRETFGIENFKNGEFGIDTNHSESNELEYLSGILRAIGVKNDDGKSPTGRELYGCKIKVRDGVIRKGARTKVFNCEDVVELWKEY